MSKTVWITGASGGIGESLARKYAERDYNIILSARRENKLHELAASFPNRERAFVLPMDVTNFNKMPVMVDKAISKFGKVDICILNAGLSHRSFISNTRFEVFEHLIKVNYLGSVAHAMALLPEFQKEGSGHFVVISSLMGKFSTPGRAGYSASKHALHGFFDGLRLEEGPQLKVTIICPGFVQTNVTANALTGDGKPQGTIDKTTAEGIPVEKATNIILRAIDKEKKEIAFGGIEKTGLYIKQFFPSFLDTLILKNRKHWDLERQ